MSNRTQYREAFREEANVVGLSAAVALSVATLNLAPLLVGLVAEAAYLLFVPDTPWYAARLQRRRDAALQQRRNALKAMLWPALRPELRARFERLEGLRAAIEAEAPADQPWLREVARKLDFLLEQYLRFAGKEAECHAYLGAVRDELRAESATAARRHGPHSARRPTLDNRKPADTRATGGPLSRDPEARRVELTVGQLQALYEAELEEVRAVLAGGVDVGTRAVLEKRLEVLQRRREFVAKTGRILLNLGHQLRLLEDSFGLVNDELRARAPEQVLADIDDVVGQTNTMTTLLEEVAPLEQVLARLSR